jgi:hypothetical protein
MPRGYRCIILAAVGWLILAAAPQPYSEDQDKQAERSNKADASLARAKIAPAASVQIVQPTVNPPPCGPGQYDSKDDLCAQWKAADSASDAAFWAMFSTIVALLGTMAIFYQVKLTREAVQDTGEATKIMQRDFETRFRPWLIPKIEGPFLEEGISIPADEKGRRTHWLELIISIANKSDIPATILHINLTIQHAKMCEMPTLNINEAIACDEVFFFNKKKTNPATGEVSLQTRGMAWIFETPENRGQIYANPKIFGQVWYSDPLGNVRELGFGFTSFFTGPMASYSRWGGAQHNYDRDTDPSGHPAVN